MSYKILGGGRWIRTTEARASDLQSDPFGHSGTPPEGRTFSRCQEGVSTPNFTLKTAPDFFHSQVLENCRHPSALFLA